MRLDTLTCTDISCLVFFTNFLILYSNRDSSVGKTTGWMTVVSSPAGIFVSYSTAFKPALGRTQLLIGLIQRAISLGVKRRGVNFTTHLTMVELHLYSLHVLIAFCLTN